MSSLARSSPAVSVRGLRDFQRELRSVDPKLARAIQKANKQIAEKVAAKARDNARSKGGVQAHAADAIQAAAEQRAAKIVINKGRAFPMADGAFFGAKRYPQFEAWVGNQFEMPWPTGGGSEGPGQGPYAISPAIGELTSDIEDFYLNAFEEAVAGAFPADLASLGRSVLGL